MTMPALPAENSTAWYGHYQALHTRGRTVVAPALAADGTTDDRAALQAAIDAAPAGATIQLPPGRIGIGGAGVFLNKQGLTLQGAGTGARGDASQDSPGTTLLALSGFSGSAVLTVHESSSSVAPLHGVTVRDLTVDGANRGSGAHGIWWRSHTSLLHHVHVWRATGDGVRVQGYTAAERTAAGVPNAVDWTPYEFVGHALVVGKCAGAGFRFGAASADGKLSDSTLLDNADNLIVEGASQQIVNVHCYDAGDGGATGRNVIFRGGSRTKMIGCKIEGAAQEGILFDSATIGSSDVQIVGCQFADNSNVGNGAYSHLTVNGSGSNGTSRLSVVGCNFSRKSGTVVLAQYAISLSASAQRATLSGITADPTHFSSGAVTLDGAPTTATNRTVAGDGSGLAYTTLADGRRLYTTGADTTRPTSMLTGDLWLHD